MKYYLTEKSPKTVASKAVGQTALCWPPSFAPFLLRFFLPFGVSLSLAACQNQAKQMEPAQLLARASIDLRGVRPSIEELQSIEADPAQVDVLIESYLQDPRFSSRVVSLFADIYRTRLDEFPVRGEDFGVEDEVGFVTSVGEEPLRMLAHIAENDLPYGQIASGNFTMSNEVLGKIWPVDYPEGETGWKPVRYVDGRPESGILTMNSMWMRYGSTYENANRGRANAISRILLCQDYLSQPIQFKRDINLLDPEATSDAIRNNEGCVACHGTLEPLAASFWGFFQLRPFDPIEASFYHPEREPFYFFTNQVTPAYYGAPVSDLTELGGKIAQDPRLAECVTQQVYEGLLARPSTFEDTASLGAHREAFVDSGARLKTLFRSVLQADEYRSRADDPRFTSKKMLSVDLIASQIEDLTGYRFTSDGVDMLRTSSFGLRTLAGGADGLFTTQSATKPTVTMALVVERLAEMASSYVVEQDYLQSPATAKLFTEIDFTETPDTNQDKMILQLQKLRQKVLSQSVSERSREIKDDLELWQSIYDAEGSTRTAWAGVLSALLQDPDFIFY